MSLAKVLCGLFLAASIIPMNAKDEGFSGKWVLDKSAQHVANAPVNLQTTIKQDGQGIIFESTFREPENGVVPLLYLGVMTNKLRLSLDGQPQQNQRVLVA